MRADLWVQPQEERPWKRQKFTDAELVWQASQKFLEPVSCGVCRHQGSAAETGPETANCWGNPEVALDQLHGTPTSRMQGTSVKNKLTDLQTDFDHMFLGYLAAARARFHCWKSASPEAVSYHLPFYLPVSVVGQAISVMEQRSR